MSDIVVGEVYDVRTNLGIQPMQVTFVGHRVHKVYGRVMALVSAQYVREDGGFGRERDLRSGQVMHKHQASAS